MSQKPYSGQTNITLKCPNCKTVNAISNRNCSRCRADLKQAVFSLYKQLVEEQNGLLKERNTAAAEAVMQKEKQVLAAYRAMTEKDYKGAARNFLIVSSIILPIQVVLLYIVMAMRNHSHSTANTIFLDGILLSGIANVLTFFATLALFVSAKAKGDL